MSEVPLNSDELSALRGLDTPTVCNALEICLPERRSFGFTTQHLHCVNPKLPPMVGYARTSTIRALRASTDDPTDQKQKRIDCLVLDLEDLLIQLGRVGGSG